MHSGTIKHRGKISIYYRTGAVYGWAAKHISGEYCTNRLFW